MGARICKQKKKAIEIIEIIECTEVCNCPRERRCIKPSDDMQTLIQMSWIFDDSHSESIHAAIFELNIPASMASIICLYLDNRMDGKYFRLCHSEINESINDGYKVCPQWVNTMLSEYNSLKVSLFGGAAAGTSALAMSFIHGVWKGLHYDPTMEHTNCGVLNVDGIGSVVLDLLDTAGQEQFKALQYHWMMEADIIVLCFQMDQKDSMDRLVRDLREWKKKLEIGAKGVMIVACHMELIDDEQLQSKMEMNRRKMEKLCYKCNIPMIEVNLKEHKNVDFLFTQIVYEYWLQTTTASINWKAI